MNANYPTVVGVSQTASRFTPNGNTPCSSERTLRPSRPGPGQPAAGREMRKALRAAEMAAWEAAPPSTKLQSAKPAHTASLPEAVRAATREGLDGELLLIVLLTAAALMGLLITVEDTSALLSHWSQFVAAIRNLIA